MSPLSDSIQKTLAYFSIFKYPLSKEEIFAYLWQPPRMSYEDFVLRLSDEAQGKLSEKYSYYFFNGHEDSVEKRRQKLLYIEEKMEIARRAAKRIRSVPFLRSIFVCNSVGSGMADKESDIDFFIITAPHRIWLVRFFSNLILRALGLRTYGKKTKNKICLSFYVDENSLNLQSLSAIETDVHFIYWLNQMVPIYDPENYYKRFISANQWSLRYLPNITRISDNSYFFAVNNSKSGLVWKKIWEKMWSGEYGFLLERQVRILQEQIFKQAIKEAVKRRDNSVVASDTVLKFHENDARINVFEKWKDNLTAI